MANYFLIYLTVHTLHASVCGADFWSLLFLRDSLDLSCKRCPPHTLSKQKWTNTKINCVYIYIYIYRLVIYHSTKTFYLSSKKKASSVSVWNPLRSLNCRHRSNTLPIFILVLPCALLDFPFCYQALCGSRRLCLDSGHFTRSRQMFLLGTIHNPC